MADLVQRFKAETLDRTGQIEIMIGALDTAADPAELCDAIRDHAHKIKGASGMFGFDELKERANELEEEASAQGAAADGATAADALRPVFGEVLAAVPVD